MDDEAIQGITITYAAGFSVENDIVAFLQIGGLIKISMDYTCTGLYHWHFALLADPVDKRLAATGYKYVDITYCIK